jgi:hypothetical protein
MIMRQTIHAVIARADPTHMASELRLSVNDRAILTKVTNLTQAVQELVDLIELLQEAHACVHIRLLLKLYHVGWGTLSDMTAILIDEVFDLGNDEKDIDLGRVRKNRHVKSSGIPEVLAKHAKAIEHDRFTQARNDIVHRGWLNDPELNALGQREANAMIHAALFQGSIDDEPTQTYFRRELDRTGLGSEIASLVNARAGSLKAHLDATMLVLEDIDVVLAKRISSLP